KILYLYKGLSEYELNDFANAADDLTKAIALGAKDIPAYAALANIAFSQKRWADATKYYDEVIKGGSTDAGVHESRGIARLPGGDTAGAVSDFDKALTIDGSLKTARYNRGAIRFRQADYANALRDLEAAGDAGNAGDLDRMMGIALYHTGNREKASPYLEKTVASGTTDKEALRLAGYMRYDKGDYPGAVDALTRAETSGAKEPELYLKRGLSHYQTSAFDKAVSDLEKAGTESLEAVEAHGISLVKLQREKEALALLEKAVSLGSKNADVHYALGNAAFLADEFTKAIQAYDRAIGLGANNEVIFNNRGKAKLLAGQVRESIADFD